MASYRLAGPSSKHHLKGNPMRKSSHKAALRRNGKGAPGATLPLFAWAETRFARDGLPPETLAIRTIARRYGVPVHLARVIAEAANIGARA